jgi:hypothetical protein
VRIDPSDKLPKGVCQRCLKVLQTAHELRELSVQNDYKFRQKVSLSKPQRNHAQPSISQIVKREQVTYDENNDIFVENEFNFENVPMIEENSFNKRFQSSEDNWSEGEDEESNFSSYYMQQPKVEKRNKRSIQSDDGEAPKHKKRIRPRAKCDVDGCDTIFSNSSNLKRHMRRYHDIGRMPPKPKISDGIKNFDPDPCQFCGARFTRGSNLRRHLRNIHQCK